METTPQGQPKLPDILRSVIDSVLTTDNMMLSTMRMTNIAEYLVATFLFQTIADTLISLAIYTKAIAEEDLLIDEEKKWVKLYIEHFTELIYPICWFLRRHLGLNMESVRERIISHIHESPLFSMLQEPSSTEAA